MINLESSLIGSNSFEDVTVTTSIVHEILPVSGKNPTTPPPPKNNPVIYLLLIHHIHTYHACAESK